MSHTQQFFWAARQICGHISYNAIEDLAEELAALRNRNGRLFVIGVGGSAANCSHAVNDFRKLCGIQAFSPADNISELTARINDDGWESAFAGWLEGSELYSKDAVLVLSVGGGDLSCNISVNIVKAIEFAKSRGAKVFGIVGREQGYTAINADLAIVVPQINPLWLTPLSEAFQAVVWHCLVSNPKLQHRPTKW